MTHMPLSLSYCSCKYTHMTLSLSYCSCKYTHMPLSLSYCSCKYTHMIPHVIHCPKKDARARSDRLQLATAHIQSFTQTRQVSVVTGRTRFWLLSSLSECNACLRRGSHRHASSGFVSVQTDPAAQS